MLIENGVRSLPVNMLNITSKNHDWLIQSYSESGSIIQRLNLGEYLKENKGLSLKESDNNHIIIYDDGLSFMERNFVIAHEAAHIILGHSTMGRILGKSKDQATESRQESEADAFAAYLLAPASVLLKAGIFSSERIKTATAVSDAHLLEKANEIATLKETSLSPAESRLCKQFRSYILRQRLQRYKKYVLILLICGIIIAGIKSHDFFTQLRSEGQGMAADEIPNDQVIVYITPTGEKFHLKTCSSIRNSDLTEITIKEAIDEGYGACKICRPLNFRN